MPFGLRILGISHLIQFLKGKDFDTFYSSDESNSILKKCLYFYPSHILYHAMNFYSARKSFYLSNGTKIEAEMMERTSYEFVVSEAFQFKELTNDLKYKAISVPYEVIKAIS